jgi:hypothetical protein
MARPFVRRLGRVLSRIALGVLLLLLGLVLLVTLALDLPMVRELVRKRANAELEQALMGKITLDRLGELGFRGVGGVEATITDPGGRRVIVVRGVEVDVFWPRIVWSALTDDGFIDVGIDGVRVRHAEVVLRDDGTGGPTLSATFEPRTKTKTPSGPPTDVRVRVSRLRADHAWIHGKLGGAPPIDGEFAELLAALRSDAKGTTLSLDRTKLTFRALPNSVDPSGNLSGRLDLPPSGGPRGSARFAGVVAGAKLQADGAWNGATLHALVSSPDVSGPTARRFGLAVSDPTSLRVAADGPLSDVRFTGELAGAAVHAELRGQATISDETRVTLTLDARDVDLSRLSGGAPSSRLSAQAELALRVPPSGALDATYRIQAAAGRVAAQPTPALQTDGTLRRTVDGELRVAGKATIDEPGSPVGASYEIFSKGEALRAHAALDARLRNPPRLTALGIRATGTLAASADYDSSSNALDARAKLRLASLRHEAARADAVVLDGRVRGKLSDPTLDAEVTAGPVEAGGRRFKHVAATVIGRPSRLAVHALVEGTSPERAELAANVSFSRGSELDGVRVTLFDSEGPIELSAAKVVLRDGALRVERFQLRGAGNVDGTLDVSSARQRFDISASDLELGRLARVAGVRSPLERGLVSADVSLERRPSALNGRARVKVSEIRIGKLDNASAAVDLAFTPKNVSGTADADFGKGGRLHVELSEFEPPREPWTLERFAEQPGTLVARGELRLAGFFPLIEAAGLPIERIGGTASFELDARGGAGKAPALEARLVTKGLRLVERRAQVAPVRTAKEARELEPRALEDIDIKLMGRLEPQGDARLELELYDDHGTIVALAGDARLPENWPRTLATQFRTLPVSATLDVPRRPLEIFPRLVRPAAAKGIASAHLVFEGSLADPKLDGQVAVDRLRARRNDEPVNVALTTHYERARGELRVTSDTRERSVGDLRAEWRGDALRLASAGTNGPSPIELELDGKLDDFPLNTVPALRERRIRGPLSGTVRLQGLGKNAKLDATFDGSKMKIGRVRMQTLRAKISVDEGRVHVQAEGGDESGKAELDLRTAVVWGDRLVPSAPNEAEGRLVARGFRLETLSPALKQYLNELSGRLDADLGIKLAPGNNRLSGEASVRDAVVQVPAVGERFTDIGAKVRIEGDRVFVRDVSARGPTGRVTARATARLDGLSLVAAEAHVAIKEAEKIPVTLEGAALGDAWGRMAVLYRNTPGATEIRVDVPSLHVDLAEQGDLEVQSLDEPEGIRIGARLADGTFTALPVQPLEGSGDESSAGSATRVRVRLGKNVEIQRGRALRVKLGGEVLMTSDGESRMTGRLELREGSLDVQGKIFEIERGVVSFQGDASNPTITATARWDSPAGYTLYADYSGDVENGKITLRSEPPLNQDEVLSLLMFGDPEGSVGTGSGDTNSAATAVGVAGDTAAKGINHALSDLTNLDVAARVDTSTGTARPELVVQISPRVAARVTRAVGEPQAGQPPDRTFLTIEFRFTRSWSVSGVVGDHGGSGLDVIWRRRY